MPTDTQISVILNYRPAATDDTQPELTDWEVEFGAADREAGSEARRSVGRDIRMTDHRYGEDWQWLNDAALILRDKGVDAMRALQPTWTINGWIQQFAAARDNCKRREEWDQADRYHRAVVRLKQWNERTEKQR